MKIFTSIISHIKMLVNYPKAYEALQAAWYAMEKHAPAECQREITTSKKVLIQIGNLPKQ